ncbi:unnamed protein product [Danaus chrysippus]|uniref:(African queen) hypothetical protein n=1 Tax=Danaus chrysippus TaxID=151541 RepID=A0A8J2QC12_9NEOP|nr:unnamed protein product [Danaus chrysippus]
MAVVYLILALFIQNTLTHTQNDVEENQIEAREILKTKPDNDEPIQNDFKAPNDWMDIFLGNHFNPTSSASLMAQATFNDKSPEEQLEAIKEMANQITMVLQSEMANLLSYAINYNDKEADNKLRKKRSIETPMDSTHLVMRLLKHIKSNNEYQNVAIEKMMTAQEIADKYGINFSPDTEILSDLAVAANEQAREMTDILQNALELKNVTKTISSPKISCPNDTQIETNRKRVQPNISESSEPEVCYFKPDYNNESPNYNYYYTPIETQIPAPKHSHAPVSQRPTFYNYIPYPTEEYLPYCSLEPMTVVLLDEPILPEPEMIGEEYEETVSSKVVIDEDQLGISTVNHVMTYTLSEKAHFKTPKIEELPQQMQYYFLLM